MFECYRCVHGRSGALRRRSRQSCATKDFGASARETGLATDEAGQKRNAPAGSASRSVVPRTIVPRQSGSRRGPVRRHGARAPTRRRISLLTQQTPRSFLKIVNNQRDRRPGRAGRRRKCKCLRQFPCESVSAVPARRRQPTASVSPRPRPSASPTASGRDRSTRSAMTPRQPRAQVGKRSRFVRPLVFPANAEGLRRPASEDTAPPRRPGRGGNGADRHLRLALRAWRGTSTRGAAAAPRARVRAARCRPIEINGTFYSLQRPELFAAWHDATPADFVFAVKGGRFITHMKRLKRRRDAARQLLRLGRAAPAREARARPLAVPPQMFRFDAARLEALLPAAAARHRGGGGARAQHDDALAGRACSDRAKRPLRHAVEVRHESFVDPAFIELLRRHGIALVVADTAGLAVMRGRDRRLRLRAPARRRGALRERLLASGARPVGGAHRAWGRGQRAARRAARSPPPPPRRAGRDVYCYFDNDAKVHAPYDAAGLIRRVPALMRPCGFAHRAPPAREPAKSKKGRT